MYPFRAIRKEIKYDHITGEESQEITEIKLDSLADERLVNCIGRTATCKCWNKEYGDYVMDSYTYLKPIFKRNKEDEFYDEVYYFHTKQESDEFYIALNKIMDNKAPF